jgi:hypothetical protein
MKGNSFWSGLLHAFAILRQRQSLSPEIEYYRARSVRIISRPLLPVQVDGDSIGETPMTFEVVQGALQALMPPHLPDDLVSRPPVKQIRSVRGMQRLAGWLQERASRPPVLEQTDGMAPTDNDGHMNRWSSKHKASNDR